MAGHSSQLVRDSGRKGGDQMRNCSATSAQSLSNFHLSKGEYMNLNSFFSLETHLNKLWMVHLILVMLVRCADEGQSGNFGQKM